MIQRTKVLIAYATFSGNTEEVAELVKGELDNHDCEVTMHRIGIGVFPDVKSYDVLMIGSYTWDKGSTPNEVKDFVADVGCKPDNVFIFGTGDTQFGGDDLFCLAVDKLSNFYNARKPGLKIEQSPRGTQEIKVINWAKGVIEDECFRKRARIKESQSVGSR